MAPIKGLPAFSLLLTRSFLPTQDRSGIRLSLEFTAHLTETVPSYELGLVPGDPVAYFVRRREATCWSCAQVRKLIAPVSHWWSPAVSRQLALLGFW